MFNEYNYVSDYDDFGLDDNDNIFNSRPEPIYIETKIIDIDNKLKSFDKNSSVEFEVYNNIDRNEMYSLHKKQLYRKHGYIGKEIILIHGTDEKNISEILENDFSLTISIKHGVMFGKGIYFTNCIQKALQYSEKAAKIKYVIMSVVYIGDVVTGNAHMDIHPKMPNSDKRYDTSVDNLNYPIQFIKKSNNQYNILGVLKINLSSNNITIPSAAKWQSNNKSLKIINNSNQLIKLYWIPNNFNIFDPKIDVRTYGKFMGDIKPNSTSGISKTQSDHKFICSTQLGYVKQIIIKNIIQVITISKDYNL